MAKRGFLLSTASLATLVACLAGPALAGGPAVSQPNGKLGAFAGSVDGDFTFGSTGSFALPLAPAWGAQVDGLVGTAAGGAYYGVGAHVFTRDPSKGLLGLYASYVGWGTTSTFSVDTPEDGVADITGANVGKLGVEGEAYLGRVSFEGLAAYQFGTNTGFAGNATVAFYPTDNLRLDLGYSVLTGPGGSVHGGVEWAPTGRASLFAEAAASSTATSVVGGVKMSFGSPAKSLIRRQREDDPQNLLPDDLYTIVGDGYCPAGTHELKGFCDSNT